MPVSIAITSTCDFASLVEAKELIDELLKLYPEEEIPEQPAGIAAGAAQPVAAADRKPEDFVEKWIRHLGAASRKFWKVVATFANTPSTTGHLPPLFTFDDIERYSGIPKASLRSYHRNSYRAIKYENAPDPMPGAWAPVEKMNYYGMTPAVIAKILEITRNDP